LETVIKIILQGGQGGNGCISFRREKYIPKGGPDGGDGGIGGSVILKGTTSEMDLHKLKGNRLIKAGRGGEGKGRKKTGKAGENTIVNVPLGTRVVDEKTGKIIGELLEEGHQLLVAEGGKLGKGNTKFATSRNKIPLLAETGGMGEEREVVLELFPMVDIIIIGDVDSNAKSVFDKVTEEQKSIKEYKDRKFISNPFQVREVEYNWMKQKIGLISSTNLKINNLEEEKPLFRRAKIICLFYIFQEEEIDIEEIIRQINKDPFYVEKPEIFIIKEDLILAGEDYDIKKISDQTTVISYDAKLDEIITKIIEKIKNLRNKEFIYKKSISINNVISPREEQSRTIVEKKEEGFIVFNNRAERLVVLPDQRSFAARIQLRKELSLLGVIDALEKAGVKEGDNVTIGKKDFIWE
tara:strand:+ start:1424 stop:2653 length:1230 start_codon:yes stop_codon:yes gene_type:complete